MICRFFKGCPSRIIVLNVSQRLWNSTTSALQKNQDDSINPDISSGLKVKDELQIEIVKVPTKKKTEYGIKMMLSQNLKHFFSCSEVEAVNLVDQNKMLWKIPLAKINANIEFLYENNIKAKTIIENPWLLGAPIKLLDEKIKMLEKLLPRDINDFIPMIRVSPLILNRTHKSVMKERKHIPEGNRIYYFSQRLEVEPALVAKYFSTHMFMFEVAFDQMEESLNIMLEFKVTSISILRDLWAFKYLPKSIRTRLERCQNADKGNLKPWMIRCTEEILERSLTISQENKNLLGDSTVIEYISNRLGYDIETTKNVVSKHVQVMKVRVPRMKDILDYLLIEEKFHPFEIANVIRILCHSLETTKKRLNELKEHGCRPTSLIIVCKSQSEYNKFLQTWIQMRKKRMP